MTSSVCDHHGSFIISHIFRASNLPLFRGRVGMPLTHQDPIFAAGKFMMNPTWKIGQAFYALKGLRYILSVITLCQDSEATLNRRV